MIKFFSESSVPLASNAMPPSGHGLTTYSHFPPPELAFPPAQNDTTEFLHRFSSEARSMIPLCPATVQFNDMSSGPGFSPWWSTSHLSITIPNLFDNINLDSIWETAQSATFFFPECATQPLSPSPAWLSTLSSSSSNKPAFFTDKSEVLLANISDNHDLRCWDHGCNGRIFKTRSILLRHRREKLRGSRLPCPGCHKLFTRRSTIKAHQRNGTCKNLTGRTE